jgi:hypothetical protein
MKLHTQIILRILLYPKENLRCLETHLVVSLHGHPFLQGNQKVKAFALDFYLRRRHLLDHQLKGRLLLDVDGL